MTMNKLTNPGVWMVIDRRGEYYVGQWDHAGQLDEPCPCVYGAVDRAIAERAMIHLNDKGLRLRAIPFASLLRAFPYVPILILFTEVDDEGDSHAYIVNFGGCDSIDDGQHRLRTRDVSTQARRATPTNCAPGVEIAS